MEGGVLWPQVWSTQAWQILASPAFLLSLLNAMELPSTGQLRNVPARIPVTCWCPLVSPFLTNHIHLFSVPWAQSMPCASVFPHVLVHLPWVSYCLFWSQSHHPSSDPKHFWAFKVEHCVMWHQENSNAAKKPMAVMRYQMHLLLRYKMGI